MKSAGDMIGGVMMSDNNPKYVICYDVSDDKRRRSLVRCLNFYGDRVQGSVFEAFLAPDLLDEMQFKISKIIDDRTDSVFIYPLNGVTEALVKRMGANNYDVPERSSFFIM